MKYDILEHFVSKDAIDIAATRQALKTKWRSHEGIEIRFFSAIVKQFGAQIPVHGYVVRVPSDVQP